MMRDILIWWARQMRGMLLPRVSPAADAADALIITAGRPRDSDAAGAARIGLVLRRRRRETTLGQFRLDAVGERAARAAIRQKPRRVVLRPDPSLLLERDVVLPLAAEQDLSQALAYEMDRLTPFTAAQVFWAAEIRHRDRAARRLELSLALVPRSLLQPVLAACERIGLVPDAIEATNQSGVPRRITLRAPATLHRGVVTAALCLVVTLALGAVVTPFITQAWARGAVEARIAALQPQLARVDALRRRIATGAAGSDVIAAEQARLGDALQVLATVTDVLPDDTVLVDLSLREGRLEISGRSAAAAQLIPAMAADATLHNPSFAAPVTRANDKMDTFVIRAELSP